MEGLVSCWVPSCGDDDDVDISNIPYPIKVPDDSRLSSPTSPTLSRTSSNNSQSHHILSFDPPPSSPDSSVDHTDDSHIEPSLTSLLSSSDRRAIRNRLRDPDWVPRPRNAFIIFRCEYSRKHARDPSDSSDKSGRSDKTLSKRAGEEWRRLSAAEREQYKILAEQEKAAHALQNPDYRFKPMRRPPIRMASPATRARLGTCRRNDRSAQVASLILRSERGAPSLTRVDMSIDESHSELITAQAPPTIGVVMGRRRSASLPQLIPIEKAVTLPAKPRTPGPISCTSSPGSTAFDFDMASSSSMDDSPLYTPSSPVPHTLPSGFPMVPLPEHPSPLNEAFQGSMDVGSSQVRPLSSVFSSPTYMPLSDLLGTPECHFAGIRSYRIEF
jgi:HMG (high mobility group) box